MTIWPLLEHLMAEGFRFFFRFGVGSMGISRRCLQAWSIWEKRNAKFWNDNRDHDMSYFIKYETFI